MASAVEQREATDRSSDCFLIFEFFL